MIDLTKEYVTREDQKTHILTTLHGGMYDVEEYEDRYTFTVSAKSDVWLESGMKIAEISKSGLIISAEDCCTAYDMQVVLGFLLKIGQLDADTTEVYSRRGSSDGIEKGV